MPSSRANSTGKVTPEASPEKLPYTAANTVLTKETKDGVSSFNHDSPIQNVDLSFLDQIGGKVESECHQPESTSFIEALNIIRRGNIRRLNKRVSQLRTISFVGKTPIRGTFKKVKHLNLF